jgi:hypothetical protein
MHGAVLHIANKHQHIIILNVVNETFTHSTSYDPQFMRLSSEETISRTFVTILYDVIE